MKGQDNPTVSFNLRLPAPLNKRLIAYNKKNKPHMSRNAIIVEAVSALLERQP